MFPHFTPSQLHPLPVLLAARLRRSMSATVTARIRTATGASRAVNFHPVPEHTACLTLTVLVLDYVWVDRPKPSLRSTRILVPLNDWALKMPAEPADRDKTKGSVGHRNNSFSVLFFYYSFKKVKSERCDLVRSPKIRHRKHSACSNVSGGKIFKVSRSISTTFLKDWRYFCVLKYTKMLIIETARATPVSCPSAS